MGKYEVHVTLEASSIQSAINNIVYPDGEELPGISVVWAEVVE